jgi:hypothetical protein
MFVIQAGFQPGFFLVLEKIIEPLAAGLAARRWEGG